MSFDGLLINLMRIVNITAADLWMEPDDIDVDIGIPCRIMYDTRLMKNYKGEEVLSAAKIFVKTPVTFEHEDRLQLDVDTPSYSIDHPIIIIKQPQNSVITHHAEVWVQ